MYLEECFYCGEEYEHKRRWFSNKRYTGFGSCPNCGDLMELEITLNRKKAQSKFLKNRKKILGR